MADEEKGWKWWVRYLWIPFLLALITVLGPRLFDRLMPPAVPSPITVFVPTPAPPSSLFPPAPQAGSEVQQPPKKTQKPAPVTTTQQAGAGSTLTGGNGNAVVPGNGNTVVTGDNNTVNPSTPAPLPEEVLLSLAKLAAEG